MQASLFATIFSTAFEDTALRALAWIALLVTLILVESLYGRIASSRESSGPRSATTSRRGRWDGRLRDEYLTRWDMARPPRGLHSRADGRGDGGHWVVR